MAPRLIMRLNADEVESFFSFCQNSVIFVGLSKEAVFIEGRGCCFRFSLFIFVASVRWQNSSLNHRIITNAYVIQNVNSRTVVCKTLSELQCGLYTALLSYI